jgi:hypothetical protein
MAALRAALLGLVAFACACADPSAPISIAPPNKPVFHVAIGGQAVVRAGFGTPTIDGVFSAGEWAGAATVSFAANLPAAEGGGTTPATLYFLNDGTNLYVALKAARARLDITALVLSFDNEHTGSLEINEGDDALVLNLSSSLPPVFSDNFETFLPPCPAGSICGPVDTSAGGTNDGGGSGSNDGSFTYAELRHPLNSSDDAHDFSLSPGDIVGFHVLVRFINVVTTPSFGDTDLPSPIIAPYQFADLQIASAELPVTIDVKPGSDVNSINLRADGTTPVAILSSATFDATTVDPSTVRLSGAAVALRPNGTPMAGRQDVNGDGRDDLVVHVVTSALRLGGGLVEAILTGRTFDGQEIRGSDWVTVRGA